MLAHIRNNTLIKLYPEESGWVDFEDGTRMSPPVVGTWGNDKIVPVVREETNTSTGSDTVTTDTGWVIETDRVYRLVATRDLTAQEIADREQLDRDNAINEIDNDDSFKALARAIWHVHNGSVPAQVTSPANFRTWLRELMDQA